MSDELTRIRDGAAILCAEWRAEKSSEFALAAQELEELIANPDLCESFAMAVASLRRENAALKAGEGKP